MISREEAIQTCYELIASGILEEHLEERIQDIASCIEAECIGRHEWGVSNELLGKIYVSKRADLITQEDIEEKERVHRLITYVPSDAEKLEIYGNVGNKLEEVADDEVEIEDIEEWFRR